jgi:hypothetical protein
MSDRLAASDVGQRVLLRHAVATLAYRAAKALRHAPPSFATFQVGPGSRTPVQIVAHMGDLIDWAAQLAQGQHVWHNAEPATWDEEQQRFFAALQRFDTYLASEAALGWSAERLFQGPIADALTHVGQLTMLRRVAQSPIRAENYAKANIAIGHVGSMQPSAVIEFE